MAETNETNWDYKPDEPEAKSPHSVSSFEWEAPEYIAHNHGVGWYLALTIITAGAAAGIYFISSRDIVATAIVALLGVAVGVFAGHQPGTAKYQIGPSRLKVNGKSYEYAAYKSFSISREPEFSSLNITPLKRLMPPLTVNYDPKDEKKILEALGDRLPYDPSQADAIDRLARRLRL